MKPLLFLTFQSFLNGIRRALGSPKRLISLIAAVGYYYWVFVRPRGGRVPDFGGSWGLPTADVLEGLAFAGFAGLSLLLSMGILGYRGGFRPADVDVLFPTPIPPRIVLVLRIARDFAGTLLLPLFIALVAWQPASMGLKALNRGISDPASLTLAGRSAMLAWILISMAWVCIGYATSLYVNRTDQASDRNRKIVGWSIAAFVIVVGLFIFLSLREVQSADEALAFSRNPFLRVVFPFAWAAAAFVIAPVTGGWLWGLVGLLALIGTSVGAILIAMKQIGWMYDQAAARGFDNQAMQAMQRRGDVTGVMSEMARKGKVKAGRITFVHRLKMRGAWALVWKELILQPRSQFFMTVISFVSIIGMSLMLALVKPNKNPEAFQYIFMLAQFVMVWAFSISLSQQGVTDLLRRVDLQKPLPFTFGRIVMFEIASKVAIPILASWSGSLAAMLAKPELLPNALAMIIAAPSLALLTCSVVYFVTILFPDIDDATQRGFRQMMVLLGFIIAAAPGMGLMVGLTVLKVPILISVIPSALLLMASVSVAVGLSSKFYSTYNPSE